MAKLKVLVIAYYFPPANAVAGQRVYSWCKYFPKTDFETVFITRKWTGTESSWEDLTKNVKGEVEEENIFGNTVFRLPSKSITEQNIFKNFIMHFPFMEKIVRYLLNFFGYFNIETDAHISFKKFILNYLKTNKVDLIIVSSPPLNLVRLAHEINRETGIPYHLDFRDLHSNEYLKSNYKPEFPVAVVDKLKLKFLKKWMRNAQVATIDSHPKAVILKKIYSGKIDVVTNGFESDYYQLENNKKFPQFTITLSGTYYSQQPLDIFIKGINIFLTDKKQEECCILLVGLEVLTHSLDKIIAEVPAKFIRQMERITLSQNAVLLSRSHVTFLPSWLGYKGLYTTKLFDMIASGSKILIAPGDNDVMDDTIARTKTGTVVNTVNDFVVTLDSWFNEWKKNGFIEQHPNWEEINKFSRQKTALQLSNIILKNNDSSTLK